MIKKYYNQRNKNSMKYKEPNNNIKIKFRNNKKLLVILIIFLFN